MEVRVSTELSGRSIVTTVPCSNTSVACRVPSESATTLPRATSVLSLKSMVVTAVSSGTRTTSSTSV
jgi:hypothetical protein